MPDDIEQWLEDLGLGKYAQTFIDNEIDLATLPHIVDDDLKVLGLTLGARRKIIPAIRALSDARATVPPGPDTVGQQEHTRRLAAEAERRQLTVMFCDVVGSTALSTKLDPEDYREVIRAYQNACSGEIIRYGGYVARFMGDGVLAYFCWPQAQEDDAVRAISAALSIVGAVDGITVPNHERSLAVRIGVATGSVVVGDIIGEHGAQEVAVLGETPNLAARLQGIAEPNSVVVARETRALVGGLFAFEVMGKQSLAGFEGAREAWRVLGERLVESRFAAGHASDLTPLIGREEELEILARRWQLAKSGKGQVVLVTGEPGIGKSRLVRTLQDVIVDESCTTLLLQSSLHYTNSALYPVIHHLQFAAGVGPGDTPDERLDKVEALLSQPDPPSSDTMALIAALLSIPADDRYPKPELTPAQQKDRTLAALVDHLRQLSARRPLVFVLEDAHWIDPTTFELLDLAVEQISDLPILIIVTYRPEFTAPWVGDEHVSLIALNRLTSSERTRMAQTLVGEAGMSPQTLAQIAERSDGVPLFVEELTRSVQEAGNFGSSEDRRSAADVVIPATLRDALWARLNYSPAVRLVAQVGAAIGREFHYDLLASVASLSSAELDVALDSLADSGLVFARGAPPAASYSFKHALIQDVAYASMLRDARQATHKLIEKALQELRPSIAETQPEILAHHCTEAGLVDVAIDWWTRAGQAASARSANLEAVSLLERGLSLLAELPESEACHRRDLKLQNALFGPLITVKGQYSSALETAFNRTLELCRSLDEPEAMFRALFARCMFHGMRGQHRDFNETAEEVVRRSKSMADEGALLMGHRLMAFSLFLLGQMTESRKHIDIVLSKYDHERHGHVMVIGQHTGVITDSYNAACLWILGWPDKARAANESAIARSLELDQVNTLGPVLSWSGLVTQPISRDIYGLQQTCRHLKDLTSQHKMPTWEMSCRVACAVAESLAAPSRQTAAELHSVLMDFESLTRNAMFFPIWWGKFLAENYLAVDDVSKALESVDKGLKLAESSGEHWSDSELLRVRGATLAQREGFDGNGEAEAWMRRAVDDARMRHARSFELRAATSLARLLHVQGRSHEALDTLASVFSWFTEGFDTPDLKDARALLDQLG